MFRVGSYRSVAVLLVVAALSCDSSGPQQMLILTPIRISGVVTKGPVSGATVRAYVLNADGSKGAVVGETTTSEDGRYEIPVFTAAPIVVEATGGSYTDEATGDPVELEQQSAVLSVAIDLPKDKDVAAITPLTTMAAERARAQMAAGMAAREAVAGANGAITNHFGLRDIVKILPDDPRTALSAHTPASEYIAVLAAISEQAKVLADTHSTSVSSMDLVTAMVRDATDGSFDGMEDGRPVNMGSTPVALPPDSTRGRLAAAMKSFFDSANTRNQTGLSAGQFLGVRSEFVNAASQLVPPGAVPAPRLRLLDRTSGSSSVTDERTVTVVVGNDVDGFQWIVAEDAATQPDPDDPRFGDEPRELILNPGDGLKTVYVWVKNPAGVVQPHQVSRTIILDTTPPEFGTLPEQVSEASDPDGAEVSWLEPVVSDRLDAGPSVRCSPPSGNRFPSGQTTVTCTATDHAGNASIASFSVRVTPKKFRQSLSTVEDVALDLRLADLRLDPTTLSYSITDGPAHGALTGMASDLTYTPDPDFFGSDALAFEIAKAGVVWALGRVEIAVSPSNDAPTATAIETSTLEDVPVAIVLSGTDVDGDSWTYAIVSPPAHGQLAGTPPRLVYRPDANFYGVDGFVYRTHDGQADSPSAIVRIIVQAVNDAPVAPLQGLTTMEDTARAFRLHADDADDDPLAFNIVAAPRHGTMTGSPPDLTYTPEANYHGADELVFSVSDGVAGPVLGRVDIAIAPVDDPPLAHAQSVRTEEDVAIAITLTGEDVDGDPLEFKLLRNAAHGTLTGRAPDLTYLPEADFNGDDSFSFDVSAGAVESEAATVGIHVAPVDDPPIARDDPFSSELPSPVITTYAGGNGSVRLPFRTGWFNFPDGLPVAYMPLFQPDGIAFDADDNLYIADSGHTVILKVTPSGRAYRIAGTGRVTGFSGDGGPAKNALLNTPTGLAFDKASGCLYVADTWNCRIRRIDRAGIITTVAGIGKDWKDWDPNRVTFSGDGGPATSARLYAPRDVALSPTGELFIADYMNYRVRKVSLDGTIHTVAGMGARVFSGDGLGLRESTILAPTAVGFDPAGNLLVSTGYRIQKAFGDVFYTIAGHQNWPRILVDDIPGTEAWVGQSLGFCFDRQGRIYLPSTRHLSTGGPVRRLDLDGSMHFFVGRGIPSHGGVGDGGPIEQAELGTAHDVAMDSKGDLYISDPYDNRIRKVTFPAAIISGDVTANDRDADHDPLTVSLVADVQHGRLALEFDGRFAYTAEPGFRGVDAFTYTVSDGKLRSEPAKVTLTVGPIPATGALTGAAVTLADLSANTRTNVTLAFVAERGWPADGSISITFPPGFDLTGVGAADVSSTKDLDGGFAVTVSGNALTIARDDRGSALRAGGTVADLVISNVMNPSRPGYTGIFQFRTQDAAGMVIDRQLTVLGVVIR